MKSEWRSKYEQRAGFPLRLDLGEGHFAEVSIAPLSQSLPYAWAAYAADGRARRGGAPTVETAQERAETALLELLDAAQVR